MKIRHNAHGAWRRPSAEVDDAYEAQVQRSTDKAERQYAAAQRGLDRAEERLAKVVSSKKTANRKRQLAELEALVELRRNELEQYRRMMTSVAASAEHRGRDSFRPVSFGGPS
jgi:hypothetical protein